LLRANAAALLARVEFVGQPFDLLVKFFDCPGHLSQRAFELLDSHQQIALRHLRK
jgi:hypothetical protein